MPRCGPRSATSRFCHSIFPGHRRGLRSVTGCPSPTPERTGAERSRPAQSSQGTAARLQVRRGQRLRPRRAPPSLGTAVPQPRPPLPPAAPPAPGGPCPTWRRPQCRPARAGLAPAPAAAAAAMKSKPAAHKSGNTHRVSARTDSAAGRGKEAQASAVGVSSVVVPGCRGAPGQESRGRAARRDLLGPARVSARTAGPSAAAAPCLALRQPRGAAGTPPPCSGT